ncbi:CmpA/NrtA family ABC transporter substrate-binding protein [Hirschia baltica]|uniref:Nitrate transporter n=1 Tax=Hirschia baltica (strain ATCC 49814 / DSM 5838 / IFAM 1418) TaxID=582402 RepID=C6XQF1_HIRBI|nr:CmpA/NrtA family ABC transporter substrate-binding protein [Hirschia baltica]ACT60450.1 nitrate transporter [Hirschia baltica ATCC 49814]
MNQHNLAIGFARLSDCAVLTVAKERGLFEKYNLNVTLKRYKSWAAMRDGLANKVIDAANMLAPMVVASAAGISPYPEIFTSSFAFNLNGNAITVSNALFQSMQHISPDTMLRRPLSAHGLKHVVDVRKATGQPKLVFAHVYHYSMHAYILKYWLASAGIDPDQDVELVVIPPSQMVDSLRAGQIDGYCVGEPWNNTAVLAGLGHTLITSSEIWSGHIEKVLAVRHSWANQHEDIHLALIKALLEAAVWVDSPNNRLTAAQMIASAEYVDAPLDEIVSSLTGKNRQTGGNLRQDMPDFNVFHRYAANFPWISQAKWILTQMVRWGQLTDDVEFDAAASSAFQPEIYRKAAAELNIAAPTINEKVEGAQEHAWVLKEATQPIAMGANQFIDGRVFNPAEINSYLNGFSNSSASRASEASKTDIEVQLN